MTDVQARLTTALAGRYRLERELGQGGMATVYLAQDLRHDRRVAIKVLRPELAAVIGAERFLSEIKTTANLQHPHILALFDSGAADSFLFYVMPYVEGESLRDRLNREKQLPIPEAVRLAKEVASALDYAHRHGVVHRDIKPENILLHDGSALVADFGIALAAEQAGGDRMTQTGMSLGTPSYMSPEQAMGEREIGPTSDVYALGAVTYEMLTGEAPFSGPTAQAIVAKVITEDPAGISQRRRTVPAAVEHAVLTALQKLPADRWASAKEFADALESRETAPTRVMRAGGAMPRGRRAARSLLLPGLLVACAALAAWGWSRHTPPPAQPIARYEVRLPRFLTQRLTYSGGSFALSPDGGTIAYIGRNERGDRRLRVRDRDALDSREIDGTDGADAPFFSPDGEWIGYFHDNRMYKVPVRGGPPVLLTDSAQANLPAATWRADGQILFVGTAFDLRTIPSSGGASRRVLALPDSVAVWTFPTFLPREDALLVTACSNNCGDMRLMAVELPSGRTHELVRSASRGWYTPDGFLVYARQDGAVLAQPFDLRTLTLRGAPQPVISRVRMLVGVTPELAVSASGSMLHIDPALSQQIRLVCTDRNGTSVPVDPEWQGNLGFFALSPDGRRLAVTINDGGRTEIWIKQLDRGPLTRLAFEGSLNYRPVWNPDGRTVGFISDRSGVAAPWIARADGSGPATRLQVADTLQVDEFEWSRDARWLVYRTGTVADARRLAVTELPSKRSVAVEQARFDQYMPTLSPDGRWLAYVTLESGRDEVYVRPFPSTGEARWQVSVAGGTSPVWSHSGRELFFIDRANHMVSLPVAPGPTFQPGEPTTLFTLDRVVMPPFHQGFAVSPDDRSFLLLQDPSTQGADDRFAVLTLNGLSALTSERR